MDKNADQWTKTGVPEINTYILFCIYTQNNDIGHHLHGIYIPKWNKDLNVELIPYGFLENTDVMYFFMILD